MLMNIVYRAGLLLLFLGSPLWTQALPILGQDAQPLLQLAQLDAVSPLDQLNARGELKKYLENADENIRPMLLQGLITALPSYSSLTKNSLCNTLDSLSFFWTTTHQEEAEKIIYTLYQKEPDVALKAALDRALMRAKGLYRDAMSDFNQDKIDPVVESKFRRVSENYPESSFAPKAHFYLGVYPLRAYAILKRQNQQPNLVEQVKKSNEVLQEFLKKSADHVYSSSGDRVLDAYYFRALNFVLLNQIDDAINELKVIENEKSPEETIFVFQFFYSSMLGEITGNRIVLENDVIDKLFDARKLAKYTRDHLESNKGKDFKEQRNLREFAEKLKQFKDEK